MDVVQMALICGVYAEQCLNRVHLLDLGGELFWAQAGYCARNPAFAIIVPLDGVNLHRSLPTFISLSLCSLAALLLLSSCLFQTLSLVSCYKVIEAFAHNPS